MHRYNITAAAHFGVRFNRVWNQLVRSIDPLPNAEAQQRQQLLTSLLLLFLVVGAFTLATLYLLAPTQVEIPLITVAALVGIYGLSRTRYYRYAAMLTVILIGAEPLVELALDVQSLDNLPFIAISILISSLILSDRETIIVGGVALLSLIGLVIFDPEIELEHIFSAFVFLTVMTGLVIVANSIRRRYQIQLEQRTRLLAESELGYRLIAENATDIISRHTQDGRFLYVSPACRSLLGYEPDDLIGQPLYSLIHPDDAPLVRQSLTLETNGVSTITYRIRRRDGSYMWFESTSQAVRAPGSSITHEITTVSRDVTGRQMIENALRESERQFRAAAEGSLDAFFMFRSVRDGNGVIVDFIFTEANQHGTQMLKRSRKQIVGARMSEILGVSPTSQFFQKAVSVVETGLSIDEEGAVESDRLQVGWLHHQIVPVGDGIAITARDITERKQAEQERIELAVQRERVQMLQHLISDTSHDLKTPLATLNTSVYLLKKFITDTERREHYAGVLQAQVTHLVKILDDMDSIAKLDDSRETFYFEPLELNEFIKRVTADHESLALQKQQTLDFIPAPDSCTTIADETKLRRAVTNLVTNAIHYTPSGGSITVRVRQRDQHALIEVTDTGVGIPPEDINLIFDRFYRATGTRHTHGSGLGLAITKKIVEAHDGRIEVESTPHQGSTFRIALPLPNRSKS
ncbi:MAG: PAS domain S-box protein [Anaerolineae bacterium]|nr:PAS domain S-box protein [Anaerolineae bacterium]